MSVMNVCEGSCHFTEQRKLERGEHKNLRAQMLRPEKTETFEAKNPYHIRNGEI